MKKKNYIFLLLLILGLVFSSTFGFKFHLNQGFEIIGFWIKYPTQILDVAITSSNELALTSHLLGHIFYLIFGIATTKKINFKNTRNKIIVIVFFALVSITILSEFYSYIQELSDLFIGRHIRIGLPIFLLGVLILQDVIKNSKIDYSKS